MSDHHSRLDKEPRFENWQADCRFAAELSETPVAAGTGDPSRGSEWLTRELALGVSGRPCGTFPGWRTAR